MSTKKCISYCVSLDRALVNIGDAIGCVKCMTAQATIRSRGGTVRRHKPCNYGEVRILSLILNWPGSMSLRTLPHAKSCSTRQLKKQHALQFCVVDTILMTIQYREGHSRRCLQCFAPIILHRIHL